MKPFLLVLSAPSGGGKTTIARRLLEKRNDVGYSISATTRPMRDGEQHGRDYWFLTTDEFVKRVELGHFIEHASYNGKHYGTLRSEVERLFAAGKHVVLDIDVEGARQIRQQMPEAVTVFVLPPSGTELVRRLKGRQTEGADVLRKRLAIADAELKAVGEYEYVVVNDDLDRVLGDVDTIVEAESRRSSRRDGLPGKVDAIRHEIETEAHKLV